MPRPKEFEPDEILEKAMTLFWKQGYEGTSLQELVDHLGINRFSIYDTFGNKHELFLAAVDHYRANYATKLRAVLEDENKGLEAIKGYFRFMAADLNRNGCFVQNSTLELVLKDADVEERIQETNLSVQKSIAAALRRAEEKGEIRAGGDNIGRTRFLFAAGQGMIVASKGHGDKEMLDDIARLAADYLDSL